MKAIAKIAFFDNSGLHKAGEVVEVNKLYPYVEKMMDEVATPKAKETKKSTKKKKG